MGISIVTSRARNVGMFALSAAVANVAVSETFAHHNNQLLVEFWEELAIPRITPAGPITQAIRPRQHCAPMDGPTLRHSSALVPNLRLTHRHSCCRLTNAHAPTS